MIKFIENFISQQEEEQLLSLIKPSRVVRGTDRNKILRYGSRLPYAAVMKSLKVPEEYQFLLQRLVDQGIVPELPDHLTINEYRKGQSIDWHVDSPTSGDVIVVLSLLSPAVMGMKRGSEEKKYSLLPRMLTIMTEEHRWEWKHCIHPVQDTRFSMVFRKGTKKKIS